MAAYVTTTEVIARIGSERVGQLTAESGDTPDTARIDPIVDQINARVQAAVCRRTSVVVTLADHPDTWNFLSGLAMDLAVYAVHGLRQPVEEDIKARADAAVVALKELTDGETCLPDAALEGAKPAWGSDKPNLTTLRENG